MAQQKALIKCPDCHAPVDVLPTVSLWEFTYTCTCGRGETVISWAHAQPPPEFVVAPMCEELPLFKEAEK